MNAFFARNLRRTSSLTVAMVGLLLLPAIATGAWISMGGTEGTEAVVSLLESSETRIVVDVQIPGFYAQPIDVNGETFYEVTLPGEGRHLEAGLPGLPHVCRSVIIPDQERMIVQLLEADYEEFTNLPVVPSKGNLPRTINPDDVPYSFDPIYGTDQWYPAQLEQDRNPYILRDYRGQVVDVTPFQSHLNDGTLRVARHFVVSLEAAGPDTRNTIDRVGPPESVVMEFGNLYEHHFLNWGMDRYDPVMERGSMLVITADEFHGEMMPFVEWKMQQGTPIEILDVSVIGNNQTAIDNAIEQRFLNEGLCFVLLVGDRAQVASYLRGSDESDPSYSLILGNDSYPEILIGRFSAENAAHVETQVTRTITYEKTPMAGGNWYNKGTGIASNQGPGDDGEYDNQHQDVIRQKLLNYGYTHVDQIYDPSGTAAQVTAALNEGRSTINYTGHGSTTAWSTTGFSNSHVNALTNDWMLPFITSVACVNGDFGTTTCFGEAWLRATNGGSPTGAIGAYMSSVNQSWNPPMCGQDGAIDLLVGDVMRTFGSLCFNGSCQMMDEYGSSGASEFYYWHLFGDPSVMVRTRTPDVVTLQHDGSIMVGAESYTINCPGVADAHCALYADGILYGAAYTDGGGMAEIVFDVPIEEPMTLTLTVTAYNIVPCIEQVESLPPQGPFVVFSDCLVLDNHGDYDGFCDAGEAPGLLLTLGNVGVDMATDVMATLSTEDALVEVLVSEQAIEDIYPDSTGTSLEPFMIHCDPNIPDGYNVQFNVDVTAAEGSWQCAFSLPVQAPILTGGTCYIDDSAPGGNGNGVADPGEMFYLQLELPNVGHSDAKDLTGFATVHFPGVDLLDAEGICLNAPVGGSGVLSAYEVSLAAGVPTPTTVDIHVDIVGDDGFVSAVDYSLSIGAFVDHVETDLGWTLGAAGDNPGAGAWVRVDPIGTEYGGQPCQPEDDHTVDPGSICFVTGNGSVGGSAGEADVDGGRTTLLSPVFDLSNAVSATIEYWRWYTNNLGNNPDEDYWQVDATGNGVDWVDLEYTNVSANSWNHYSFNLGDFIDLTDMVQIRFIAEDAINGSLVEAAVDDFSLVAVRVPVTDAPSTDFRERNGLVSCQPNPFNPRTQIVFRVGGETATNLKVYDVAGRAVRTLVEGEISAGEHSLVFDGMDDQGNALSSGIYFLRFDSSELSEVRQLTLLK